MNTTVRRVLSLALTLLITGGAVQAQNALPSAGQLPATGRYIVVLEDGTADPDKVADEMTLRHGIAVERRYRHALRGYAAAIPESKVAQIKEDRRVRAVVEDRPVRTAARAYPGGQLPQQEPTGIRRIGTPAAGTTGTGLAVAVLDTGIELKHPDLSSSILTSVSCVPGVRTGNDDNGHGTHVAGVIAARNNTVGVVGTAPDAKLIAVKVLGANGTGSWSSVICGIDWVTGNAHKYNIKVANVSIYGSGASDGNCGRTDNDVLHQAFCRSRDAGVTYVVAAGNEGKDTAQYVPAAYDDAVITVSALTDSDGKSGGTGAAINDNPDDTFATFSNYGSAIDLGAPGDAIYSTYLRGGYATLSGTSMAAPHVAGTAALYLQRNPGATWNGVRDYLRAQGEPVGAGHTDPSGRHSEPVILRSSL
jgi:subtilisin